MFRSDVSIGDDCAALNMLLDGAAFVDKGEDGGFCGRLMVRRSFIGWEVMQAIEVRHTELLRRFHLFVYPRINRLGFIADNRRRIAHLLYIYNYRIVIHDCLLHEMLLNRSLEGRIFVY
ncbi:MAG: hypothetical protein LBH04_03225 [Tannerellaceae bacterium]|jgi:hypothetical protein|nr:hypothetical protein [Tannerellaceae bacterium]